MSVRSMIHRRGVSVTVQAKTVTAGSGGGVINPWADSFATIAFPQPRSGAESLRYGRENNRDISIWYFQPDITITPANRFKYGTRVYDIQSAQRPDERVNGQSLAYIRVEAQETLP